MARRSAPSPPPTSGPSADTRILVLHGPEALLKYQALDRLRADLRQRHGDLQNVLVAGATASLAEVLDELRTYGLLQPYKLVIVDDADEFTKRYREALERYADAPVDSATLVLRSDTWHKGNLDKKVAKVGMVLKCEAPAAGQVPAWIRERAVEHHWRAITERAAAALAGRLGVDLLRLDSELAKLALSGDPGKPIDVAEVEEIAGRSSDELAWVIQEAVLDFLNRPTARGGDLLAKLHELTDLGGHDPVPVTWAVSDLMRKLMLGAHLKRRGSRPFDIAKELGVWGGAQRGFLEALERVSVDQARRWFDAIITADYRSKSGQGDGLLNLECFCARLADERS